MKIIVDRYTDKWYSNHGPFKGQYNDSLAQSVEHLTFNQRVRSSNLLRVTILCGCGEIGRHARLRI